MFWRRILFALRKVRRKAKEFGFSTQEVATGMTMAVLVSSIAVVTGNTIVLDTEERAHVFNGQAMTSAATKIIVDENEPPTLGTIKKIYLSELYEADKLQDVEDPSAEGDEGFYSSDLSFVSVENPVPSGNQRPASRYYVKLVSADGSYTYIDQTDEQEVDRVESKNLTRTEVAIPARSEGLQ